MEIPVRHHRYEKASMVCNSRGRPNRTTVRSWLDLAQLVPRNPSTIIEWAKLDTVIGELKHSSTYINPVGESWVADDTALRRE